MEDFLDDEKFPFGEMKGKQIKDLDEDFVHSFIKSNAYRKNKTLRDLLLKYHKETIKNKKGGKKTKKKNKKHVFYYFSADWCGYCQKFNPQWKKLVTSYQKKKNLVLKKTTINDDNEHLLHIYNIQSFPSLVLVKTSGEQIHYPSDLRDKKSIDQFLKENNV